MADNAKKELDSEQVRFNDITIPRKAESKDALCGFCFSLTAVNRIAKYMCFECETYLCIICEKDHSHRCNNIDTTTWIKADFLDLMKEAGRREKIMKTNISLCNSIYIKHDLDQMDCSVTGFSGIGDNGWVICDSFNFCIKLFDVNSTEIRRYIQFSSLPFDVTEIKFSKTSTAVERVQGTGTSVNENDTIKGIGGNQQYLVAVTFPKRQQILVLNVKQNITLRHKIIGMDKPCSRIDCFDNKIFTLCDEKPSSLEFQYSVYMLSEDGDILKIIKTGIDSYNPHFAVGVNKIILIDNSNNSFTFFDFEGNKLARILGRSSTPHGICIGSDRNVYFCSGYHIYRLIYNITLRYVKRKRLISSPYAAYDGVLCFHRDKLYVSNTSESRLDNVIRVVRLV